MRLVLTEIVFEVPTGLDRERENCRLLCRAKYVKPLTDTFSFSIPLGRPIKSSPQERQLLFSAYQSMFAYRHVRVCNPI